MADPAFKNEDAMNRDQSKSQAAAGGATDIFSTYKPAQETEDDELAKLLGTAGKPDAAPSLSPETAKEQNRPAPPIVHEVAFRENAATQGDSQALMNLLKSSSVRPVEPAPVAPPSPAPPPPSVGGVPNSGFTQLLRALNYDQAKPEPASAPASAVPLSPPAAAAVVNTPTAAPSMPSITQLLRTIDGPAPPTAKPETSGQDTPVIPAPAPVKRVETPAQVTSFHVHPPVASVPTPPAKEAGSFTQLFSTLDAAKPLSSAAEETREFVASPAASDRRPEPPAQVTPAATGSSFTQIFSALESPGLARSAPSQPTSSQTTPPLMMDAAIDPLAQDMSQPAAAPASSQAPAAGSFTQLFSVLDSGDAGRSSPAPVEQPPAAPAAGSFTQLFSTLDTPALAPPSDPLPQTPITSFQTQPATPVGPPRLDASPADSSRVDRSPGPGSFTQMFQALDAKQASEPTQPVETPRQPPLSQTPPSAGSFTEIFQALDAAPAPVLDRPVPSAGNAQPAHAPQAPQASAVSSPGSFTEVFAALGAAPVPEAHRPPEPSTTWNKPQSRDVPTSSPGSFTQLFSSPAYSQPEQPERAPSSTPEAGSFTQMFGSQSQPERSSEPAPASPAATGGSFTQLFRTLDAAPDQGRPHESAPIRRAPGAFDSSFAPPAPPSDAGLGASQMFSTYGDAPQSSRPQPSAPQPTELGYSRPPLVQSAPSQTPPSGGGGLTQLLRTLDQPAAPSGGPQTFADQRPAVPTAAVSPQAGSFTSTYGALDGGSPPAIPQPTLAPPAVSPAAQPAAFAPPPVAPSNAGPSEYTRILNASALREAGLRSGGAAPASPPAPTEASPAVSFAAPQIPAPHMPQVPQANLQSPGMPHAGGGAPAPAPHVAVPTAPKLPALPQVKAPEIKVEAAAGGMQKYLPLLLILIIFLLVALLVAVVFLMKK